MESTRGKTLRLLTLLLVLAGFVGCASTRQARKVQESGFLGDYSTLEKGKGGDETKLYHADTAARWNAYDKLLIDHVSIWSAQEKSGIKVSPADAQRMANNFYRVLHTTLGEDYALVAAPGAGTLRLQVAITELKKTRVAPNVVSTVVPQLRAATALEGYVSGKPFFTGDVAIEFKISDAETGERLSAGVDRRVGAKHLVDSWKSWQDVDDAMRFWTELLRYDLCTDRGGSGCVEPKPRRTI